MIDIIVTSIVLSLPVFIALDKGRLLLSIMLLVIVLSPMGIEIFWGASKEFELALLLFQVICWLGAFKLALNCERIYYAD